MIDDNPLHTRLIVAWTRWDYAPGSKDRAKALEEACRGFVGEGSVIELRTFLNARRGEGMTHEEAVTAWEEEY